MLLLPKVRPRGGKSGVVPPEGAALNSTLAWLLCPLDAPWLLSGACQPLLGGICTDTTSLLEAASAQLTAAALQSGWSHTAARWPLVGKHTVQAYLDVQARQTACDADVEGWQAP